MMNFAIYQTSLSMRCFFGIYKVVKKGARAREYEDALQWLVDARLVHKIYRSTAPSLPVSAYDDLSAFKIYLADVAGKAQKD